MVKNRSVVFCVNTVPQEDKTHGMFWSEEVAITSDFDFQVTAAVGSWVRLTFNEMDIKLVTGVQLQNRVKAGMFIQLN